MEVRIPDALHQTAFSEQRCTRGARRRLALLQQQVPITVTALEFECAR